MPTYAQQIINSELQGLQRGGGLSKNNQTSHKTGLAVFHPCTQVLCAKNKPYQLMFVRKGDFYYTIKKDI
jgi:hypothetical protein